MAKQQALLLIEKNGDLVVREIETPIPEPDEILVEVRSAALNPVEWRIVKTGFAVTEYPAVLGSEGAGIVKELGSKVTGFEVGDRVVYQGWFTNRNATFQQYNVVKFDIVAKIPANLTFDEAATVPIGVVTAAFGLYSQSAAPPQRGGLGLTPFWAEGGRGKYAGQPIVILGGSGTVGQQVIQIARLSGFSPIITTASLHNTAYLQSLGATHVVDRSMPLLPAVQAITSLPVMFAYDAVSQSEGQNALWDVVAPGARVLLMPPISIEEAKFKKGTEEEGKIVAMVFGSTALPSQRDLGAQLFKNLTKALENGDIKPNRVEVLPNGLAGIADGLERLRTGQISATKLIVHPQEIV